MASAQAVIITGFEAGYLTDNKVAYVSARIGCEIKADTPCLPVPGCHFNG